MAKFKYNVLRTNEICNNFSKQINEYADLNEKIYMNVKSSKNLWVDQASTSFSEIVLKDERICKDIKNRIDNYIGEISYFSNSLKKIFLSKGITLDNYDLDFDGDSIDTCINILNEINSNFDLCISDFNNTIYPLNFEYYHEVNSLYRSIAVNNKKINDICRDMQYLNKEINELINGAHNREKKLDLVLCDNKVIKLESGLVPFDSIK